MRQLATAAVMLIALTGCDDPVGDVLAATGDAANGASVFAANCQSCHPADGTQGTGPALAEEVPLLTREEMAQNIVEGEGIMPAFELALTTQEMADVLAHVIATYGG